MDFNKYRKFFNDHRSRHTKIFGIKSEGKKNLLFWRKKESRHDCAAPKSCSHIRTTKELKMDFLVALLWILKGIFIHNNRTCIFTLGGAFQKEPAAAVLLISKRILLYKKSNDRCPDVLCKEKK